MLYVEFSFWNSNAHINAAKGDAKNMKILCIIRIQKENQFEFKKMLREENMEEVLFKVSL